MVPHIIQQSRHQELRGWSWLRSLQWNRARVLVSLVLQVPVLTCVDRRQRDHPLLKCESNRTCLKTTLDTDIRVVRGKRLVRWKKVWCEPETFLGDQTVWFIWSKMAEQRGRAPQVWRGMPVVKFMTQTPRCFTQKQPGNVQLDRKLALVTRCCRAFGGSSETQGEAGTGPRVGRDGPGR